ncbi:MAG: type II toxin-antitoxin system Phd/YefM family antitoxin [Candidatus Aminicenantes bacterium]|nr:MAG: type II toxin-antitoxin system Phd/YefM family antitoxin [Candidatus Aminicenantes bacterium]
MPIIRPVSDLRNNFNEISELCHSENEPVFVTRQGKGDMVVMSHAHYEMLINLLELYQKLGEAEALDASEDEGIPHRDMMKRLKERIK